MNHPKTLVNIALIIIIVMFVMTLLRVGALTLLLPLNLMGFSLLFFALSYKAVKDQIIPHAKRLLMVGLSFLVLALVVFMVGQIL